MAVTRRRRLGDSDPTARGDRRGVRRGNVYGSCLEISIADVATTVLERPFSCLEILVHWNRLRAGSSSATNNVAA